MECIQTTYLGQQPVLCQGELKSRLCDEGDEHDEGKRGDLAHSNDLLCPLQPAVLEGLAEATAGVDVLVVPVWLHSKNMVRIVSVEYANNV